MQPLQSTMAHGLDYSHYQGTIYWQQVKADFAFGKATEGTYYIDPTFDTNYRAMKAAGIARGAYHYFKPGDGDYAGQAKYYVDTVNASGGFDGLPAMIDVEETGGLSKADLAYAIRTFATAVNTATGKEVILYTYLSFAQENLDPSLCAEFQLFIADYGVDQPPNVLGWAKWLFFQYADNGTISGISGDVDLDAFEGTKDDLNAFLGGTKVMPTVQEVDLVRAVTADALNIRSDADSSATVRYVVNKGQLLHITQMQDGWAYTSYGSLGGWVNRDFLTEAYMPVKVQIDGKQASDGINVNGNTYLQGSEIQSLGFDAKSPITYLDVPYGMWTSLIGYDARQIDGGWNLVRVPVVAPAPVPAPEVPSPTPTPIVPPAPTQVPTSDQLIDQLVEHLTAAVNTIKQMKGAK